MPAVTPRIRSADESPTRRQSLSKSQRVRRRRSAGPAPEESGDADEPPEETPEEEIQTSDSHGAGRHLFTQPAPICRSGGHRPGDGASTEAVLRAR